MKTRFPSASWNRPARPPAFSLIFLKNVPSFRYVPVSLVVFLPTNRDHPHAERYRLGASKLSALLTDESGRGQVERKKERERKGEEIGKKEKTG